MGLHYHKHPSGFNGPGALKGMKGLDNLKQPFSFSSSEWPGDFKGYSDADFANNVDDRRSITGYLFVFAGAPLSWNSMTQHTQALSTMEAEYYAVCKTVQEAMYLRMVMNECGINTEIPLVIREDNQACMAFAKDPGEHSRTKHIHYRYHFIRSQIKNGEIVLEAVESKEQLADIFTKALEPKLFKYLRTHLVQSRATVFGVVV